MSTQTNLCASTERSHGLVLDSLSAEETATLDERGLPKGLGRQYRRVQVASDGYNQDAHTVSMAVSSETPVARYYGEEILSHAKGALRTDRLKQGVALLFNHSMDQHLGRSVDFKLSDTGLQVTSRFGENPLALEKELDVRTGILVDVSIGYFVHAWDIVEDTKTGFRTYTATDWEIYEISLVTVPADPTVGVGRALAADEPPVKFNLRTVAAEPAATRSAEDDDEDDENEDEDEPDAEERAVTAAETSTPSSEPSTTNPAAQRTITMADTAVGTDLAAQNAERIAGLRQLNKDYPTQFNDRSLKAAETLDLPLAEAKRKVADAIIAEAQRSDVGTVGDEILSQMSEREYKQFSVRDAYAAAINERSPGTFSDKGAVGFAKEVSDGMRKLATERGITVGGGILIPSIASSRAAAAIRTISAGGNFGTATNFTNVSASVIEYLRSKIAIFALGATYMPGLQGKYQMPRQNAAGSSNWALEGGAATISNPGFDDIVMSPNRMTMQQDYYRDQFAQSAVSIDPILNADREQAFKRGVDSASIVGSGVAPVPLGLLNRTGLPGILAGSTRAANGTVTAGAGGVPMTYVDFIRMESTIETSNGDLGTLKWLTTPGVKGGALSTPKTPGTATEYIWPDSPQGADGIGTGPRGYQALSTSAPYLTGFSANSVNGLHACILGVWDQILIGDWGLSEVIVDNITAASNARVIITEHGYYDINVRHLESFVACTSALPS